MDSASTSLSRAWRSTWSSDVDRRPRDGAPSCVTTHRTSPPWTCSLPQPLASTCSTPSSLSGWRAETSSGSTSHLIRPRACSRSLRVTSKTNSDEAHGDALRHATCNATFLTRGHNLARPPVCTENLIRIDCVTESPNVDGALHNADIKALRVILSDPFR
jgi:hypothetical protein